MSGIVTVLEAKVSPAAMAYEVSHDGKIPKFGRSSSAKEHDILESKNLQSMKAISGQNPLNLECRRILLKLVDIAAVTLLFAGQSEIIRDAAASGIREYHELCTATGTEALAGTAEGPVTGHNL
jgi:hypothetical protein